MKNSEIYVSHVMSYLIKFRGVSFDFSEAKKFEDWGTLKEWKNIQKQRATFFLDFDGVLVENSGQYGAFNWDSPFRPIQDNLNTVRKLFESGATIVITTSRDASFKNRITSFLKEFGIESSEVICGLNHSPRYLVNDFAPTNSFPTSIAVNIPRNGTLSDYIE